MQPRLEHSLDVRVPGARILVVEDHQASREVLAEVLRDEGYEVSEAATRAEALELLHQARFDLVVSDEILEEASGSELLELARSEHLIPYDGAVLITGHPRKFAVSLPLLRKPFELGEFVALIRACLLRSNEVLDRGAPPPWSR